MKKILFCLPLLLLALQSCEIEDEYMYDKGLYTIDWDAAADSSSVTQIVSGIRKRIISTTGMTVQSRISIIGRRLMLWM